MNGPLRSKTTRHVRLGWTVAGIGVAAALAATLAWPTTKTRPPSEPSSESAHAKRTPAARELETRPVAAVEAARTPALETTDPGVAAAPIRVPELENPVLAATQAHRFTSEGEELAFWTERLRGERLTLENRKRSLEQAERVLEARAKLGTSTEGVRELERRKALLEAKFAAHARYVGEIEQRVSELNGTGSNQ
jgi:hypothetical protein